MLGVLWLLLSSLCIVYGQANFQCPKMTGNYANPSDGTCRTYFKCSNSLPKQENCEDGFKFHPHPSTSRCLLADSVDCNDPNPYVCNEANANEADPKNCSRFYYCYNSAPLHRTCAAGEVYVESERSCQSGDPSQCVSAGFKCPEPNGNFADPTDPTCHYYIACSNGKPTRYQCPLDYKFHSYPTMRRCLIPDSVDCNPKTPYVCRAATGDFLDPSDCHRYYQCVDFAPLHRRCPLNTIFYDEYRNCSAGTPQQCVKNGGSIFVCPLGSNSNFEDPSDTTCTHYYSCSNGQPSRLECPDGFRFHPHPNMRRCLIADSVDCKTTNPFKCPEATKDFVDPNNCARFYSCQNWVPLHRTCGAGTIFVDAVKRCEAGNSANCAVNQPAFKCPSDGKFADPSDRACRRYYTCVGARSTSSECPVGLRFHPHPKLQKCVIDSSYDCNDPNGQFQCPVENGDVYDPYDCGRFYSCQSGAPLHRSCDLGMVFSESLKRCTNPGSDTCKNFGCPPSDGKFPDPNDATCTHYFECNGGVRKWASCDSGFRFHPHVNMRRCLLADSVDCGVSQFQCPSQNLDVPDPGNRHRFYSCQNWVPLHRTCAQQQTFNSSLRRCA